VSLQLTLSRFSRRIQISKMAKLIKHFPIRTFSLLIFISRVGKVVQYSNYENGKLTNEGSEVGEMPEGMTLVDSRSRYSLTVNVNDRWIAKLTLIFRPRGLKD